MYRHAQSDDRPASDSADQSPLEEVENENFQDKFHHDFLDPIGMFVCDSTLPTATIQVTPTCAAI
jgi:hypothetical protein